MGMTEPLVVTTVSDGVGRLRMNRAGKRNAISAELGTAIAEAITAFDEDDSVVVIVIEGTDGSFCAGADMGEANAENLGGNRRFDPAARAAQRVAATPKPIIAAVDGPAYGAGALIACSCDIRIASDRARFRFPGSEYGLVVGAAALPKIVGGPMAKELIFTSRAVGAEEAARIGLVNRTVPLAEFPAAVDEVARAIAAASPLALHWSKRAIDASVNGGDARGLEQQADQLLRGGADHITRFAAATRRIVGGGP